MGARGASPAVRDASHETVGFGGGCHWCTEAVFQALEGVTRVEQGFMASDPPDDALSEAARVTFDPTAIPLDVLIEVHLRTHASTAEHSMRGKYRSAIYVEKAAQAARARSALDRLAPDFDAPPVTRVLPLRDFKPSDERFHDYYATDPTRPFCRTYIDPKLALLRERFADRVGSSRG